MVDVKGRIYRSFSTDLESNSSQVRVSFYLKSVLLCFHSFQAALDALETIGDVAVEAFWNKGFNRGSLSDVSQSSDPDNGEDAVTSCGAFVIFFIFQTDDFKTENKCPTLVSFFFFLYCYLSIT